MRSVEKETGFSIRRLPFIPLSDGTDMDSLLSSFEGKHPIACGDYEEPQVTSLGRRKRVSIISLNRVGYLQYNFIRGVFKCLFRIIKNSLHLTCLSVAVSMQKRQSYMLSDNGYLYIQIVVIIKKSVTISKFF